MSDGSEKIRILPVEGGLLQSVINAPNELGTDMEIVDTHRIEGELKQILSEKEVDATEKAEKLRRFLMEEKVDVVITGYSGDEVPALYQKLAFGFPHIILVAIHYKQDRAEVYDRTIVLEVNAKELFDVIREVAYKRNIAKGAP